MNDIDNARSIEILLAEDSQEDADLTRIIVGESKLRNTITIVNDGVEVLTFLLRQAPFENKARPDLVILDLNMPRMNGVETLNEIRRRPEFDDIPIAIMTTSDAEADIIQSYELRMNCLVRKPLSSAQFIDIVRTVDHFGLTFLTAH